MNLDGIIVRQADGSELIDLRHRVLRAGLPREEAMFAGDEKPTSAHFGAFADGVCVCCASFHLNEWEGKPAYQLRGMATDLAYRGMGLGKAVLELGESTITADGKVPQLWCNAREIAVPFYKSAGWEIVSERFQIPTAGPHFRMTKRRES
jgi:predicted GNAT family N-acyltransferase